VIPKLDIYVFIYLQFVVLIMNWLLIGFQTNPFMSENHYTLLTNKYKSLKHNVGSEMIGMLSIDL
jgi:hypothetical protein